jgi:hypothetical protein
VDGGGVLVELGSFGTGPFLGFRRWVRGGLFLGHREIREIEAKEEQTMRARGLLRQRRLRFNNDE